MYAFKKIETVFLPSLDSKVWFVRFIEVKFHLGAEVSVRFKQVSALECPLYRGDFTRKQRGPNFLSTLQRCQL